MTKEDFKRKYHGKSVKIEPSMQVQHLVDIAERPRRVQEMCKLMGLEAHEELEFTREQRIMLNQIKEQAQDVEFEEIQG